MAARFIAIDGVKGRAIGHGIDRADNEVSGHGADLHPRAAFGVVTFAEGFEGGEDGLQVAAALGQQVFEAFRHFGIERDADGDLGAFGSWDRNA